MRIGDGSSDVCSSDLPGAAIGPHRIAHDEVYYVLDGAGEVVSDGERRALSPGSAAYLFDGAVVGITQQGARPLTLIIHYPLPTDESRKRAQETARKSVCQDV